MTNKEKFLNEIILFTDNDLATFMYAYKIATNDDILNKKDLTIADYKKWLSKEAESSADEMFKELGYEKLEDGYSYKNKNDEIICISKQGYKYLKTLDRFIGGAVLNFITEAEDRAIHKKIEEIENGI